MLVNCTQTHLKISECGPGKNSGLALIVSSGEKVVHEPVENERVSKIYGGLFFQK